MQWCKTCCTLTSHLSACSLRHPAVCTCLDWVVHKLRQAVLSLFDSKFSLIWAPALLKQEIISKKKSSIAQNLPSRNGLFLREHFLHTIWRYVCWHGCMGQKQPQVVLRITIPRYLGRQMPLIVSPWCISLMESRYLWCTKFLLHNLVQLSYVLTFFFLS